MNQSLQSGGRRSFGYGGIGYLAPPNCWPYGNCWALYPYPVLLLTPFDWPASLSAVSISPGLSPFASRNAILFVNGDDETEGSCRNETADCMLPLLLLLGGEDVDIVIKSGWLVKDPGYQKERTGQWSQVVKTSTEASKDISFICSCCRLHLVTTMDELDGFACIYRFLKTVYRKLDCRRGNG